MLEIDSDFDGEEKEFQSPESPPPSPVQQSRPIRKRKSSPVQTDVSLAEQEESPEQREKEESICIGFPPDSTPSPVIPDGNSEKGAKKPTSKRRKITAVAAPVPPKTAGNSKKTKNEALLEQFMIDTLPALRKNMRQAKAIQSSFRIRDHAEFFRPNSPHIATFILPLFHFIGKEEIVCSRLADFNGKKFVKTEAGFLHASFIVNHALDLTDEDKEYVLRKYGKDYFKIPSKDYVKASSAAKYGDKGEFKVTLTGIYEDSFLNDEGKEILTINPVLRYDPVRAKSEKKEKKEKKEKPVAE